LKLWRREKILAPAGNLIPASQPHFTDEDHNYFGGFYASAEEN
jgi:hypothetical protein